MKLNLHNLLPAFTIIVVLNLLIAYNIFISATGYYNNADYGLYSSISFKISFLLVSLWQLLVFVSCKNLPSSILISIFLFALISPIIFYPYFTETFNLTDYLFHIMILLFSVHLIIFIANKDSKKPIFRGIHISNFAFKLVLIIMMVIGILLLIFYFRDIMSFDWSNVYDRRLESREIFSKNIFFRYYNSLFGAVLIPFCSLYGAAYRSLFLIALSFFGAFLSFAAFGGKGVFFSPLLGLLLGLYFVRTTKRNFFLNLAFLFIIFCGISSLEILITGNSIFNVYAFRRMFYVPAELTYQYWEYFSNNSVYLMSDSMFGNLFGGVEQEYPKSRLIGGVYYGKYITNANSNIFATAFGDFGMFGMPIVAIFTGFIARLLNTIYQIKNSIIVVAYSIFIGLVWTQGALHTSLLSNGIIYTLALLLLIPKRKEY